MSLLSVDHLTHGFGDRAIFEDISFRLLRGEHIGLVGANGEGKSTFMKIVTAHMEPDEGTIQWARGVEAGYLNQHSILTPGLSIREVLRQAFDPLNEKQARLERIYALLGDADEAAMSDLMDEMGELQTQIEHSDYFLMDSKIVETADALGLLAFGLDTDVSALSGGQRTKVLLAKLLLEKPDILLLDEPTNYLDVEHISWLRQYLIDYENAFILISHDMPFLNSVIKVVYHVSNCRLERFVGDYDHFLEVHEVQKNQKESAYERQQQEIASLKDFVARNKARVSTRNMAMSRQKKIDRMDVIELERERPVPAFAFQSDRAPRRAVFEARGLVIGYDEALSRPIDLQLERGQKISLVGANGIGKTTLLKSLLGLTPALAGEHRQGEYLSIGYFEQENVADMSRTCLESLGDEYPSMSIGELRSALARCGLTAKHIESRVAVLSGGEQAKLRFCKLMNRKHNLLVLDEPTNHLDVVAKDVLKAALQDYSGTILMVCHEPEFYGDIVTGTWDAREWALKL
jgi:ATPase subunit of ABC transporter with duplicated ATPase domains